MLYAIQTPYTCSLMSYFETYGNFVIEENKRPDLLEQGWKEYFFNFYEGYNIIYYKLNSDELSEAEFIEMLGKVWKEYHGLYIEFTIFECRGDFDIETFYFSDECQDGDFFPDEQNEKNYLDEVYVEHLYDFDCEGILAHEIPAIKKTLSEIYCNKENPKLKVFIPDFDNKHLIPIENFLCND